MKNLFTLALLFSITISNGQVANLKKYIEGGRTFDEIYRKASRLLREENESENNAQKPGKATRYMPEEEFFRLERWAWYWRDRTHADGTLGDPGEQFKIYQNLKAEQATYRSSDPAWKHEGPTRNTGGYWAMGRTTHVDFHPTDNKTFFIAAANGGVWKTTNGGQSYTSLGENLPQQAVGIVIVDPRNTSNLYITLGEKDGWWQYGLGVYKSTDGGKTWNPTGLSYKLTDNKVIYGMVMHPQNSNILLASTNNGIYKTVDGAITWTKVRTEDFSDIKYKYNNPNVLYAARNDYWGSCEVFQSTDGGDNWKQITSFNKQKSFFRLVTTPADPEYIGINASEDGQRSFYLSKDGGSKFEFICNPPENAVFFISPYETNVMYCGSVRVHKSYDGGFSWTQLTEYYNDGTHAEVHADHHYVGFHPRDKHLLYFCNDGGLHQYNESIEIWAELSQGLPITQFYKMAISTNTPPSLIGGSQDNGGWIRRSNGSWGNTNGGDAMWQLIDPSNAKIGYTEYWGGRAVYRTTDNFLNLTDLHGNLPADIQGQWVTPFSLNPKNPRTFLIGYHEVFISPDRGNSFKQISSGLTGAEDKDLRNVEMSPVDSNIIAASYANQLYLTYDYGKNWTKTTLPTNFDISSIEFHPTDANRMWITRAGLGTYKVMESRDKGKTWKSISAGFVNTAALVVRYDLASDQLFVGTDIGLFTSDADKINWAYYGTGLPNTSVTDIELHQATRRMYISTYGRGFYSIELPPSKFPLIVQCPGNFKDTACQSQDSINKKYHNWINSISYTGGCNVQISNNADSIPPSACGQLKIVTFTVTSDCDTTIRCRDSFSITPNEGLVLNCPGNVTEAACQFQTSINASFEKWKRSVEFRGPCNAVFSASDTLAPQACGGSATIYYSAKNDCEIKSCYSVFTVTKAPSVVLTCPANVTEAACQSQSALDTKFTVWKQNASFIGGCNGVLTNSGGTAPNHCGGRSFTTFTVTSDCEPQVSCSTSFVVEQAPSIVFTCPGNQTEDACQPQTVIDRKFEEWKKSAQFTGGCNGVMTNSGRNAPDACGGIVNVTFTVNSDCELQKTCSASFAVMQAPKVQLQCPDDTTITGSDIQSEIEARFLEWKNKIQYTGGCNLTVTSDTTPAPNGTSGGIATVKFTATSDCEAPKNCSAQFHVIGFIATKNPKQETIRVYPNPGSEFIYIERGDGEEEELNIRFITIDGKKCVLDKTILLQSVEKISVQSIPRGTYIIKISGKNGEILKQKLFIQ
ncbi:MAG: T9SS type A sorting domain-containing protein [Saprospiraceae bacterium]